MITPVHNSTGILIHGGRLIDPAHSVDDPLDVFIREGKVERIGRNLLAEMGAAIADAQLLDASGCVITPGLIDIHVHLRVPRQEHKETIGTGTLAAIRGGFTTVCCMPNTDPPLHTRAEIEHILWRAQQEGHCRVLPVAAVSMDMKHEQLAEMADMKDAGAVAVSDDAFPIQSAGFLRQVMRYAAMVQLPLVLHCEDKSLTDGGVMNEGYVSTRLGLKGMPRCAVEIPLVRSIMLAKETGCHIHIQHVSTKGEVELIARAKSEGVAITAEVCPHHFALTDEACATFDTNVKMNPPLRTQADVEAIIEGLKDGAIDCIATDHAPHAQEEKEVEFDVAPFGIVGLETVLGLTLLKLVEPGHLTLSEAIAKLTSEPARCMNIDGGHLAVGARADVTIFKPDKRWRVEVQQFASLSKNAPWGGWELPGKVEAVLVGGRNKIAVSQITERRSFIIET